jgi:hypothetical protein
MSKYLGDFNASDIIDFKFTTFRPSTGAPFTLAGSPVVSVYKDNSTTQSTAGVTLSVDFDAITGLHNVRITTSSDATFYANGGEFECVITTGTVDSVSVVGSCVGRFTLGVTASNVWDALLASYAVNNSFGQRVLRSTTSQSTCAVTGSNHIAADIHELQPAVISAADFAANAIDANALATDAVTEIVNAVMTVDPSTFPGTSSGYWLYEAGLNSQQLLSDTNYINSTSYVESIADTILGRNVGGGSNTGRLVKEALYALRNKSEIIGTTLSVYDASDALSWTATVASSSSADPVTGIDP